MRLRSQLFALFAATSGCQSPTPASVIGTTVSAPTRVTEVKTLFVAASAEDRPIKDIAAPWSLTASDGSGLRLTRVDAKAVVEGPLAFTELHLYFHNPEPRTREGTFSITLPTGAAVSRFAMENNGQFMEAEVVDKQLARQAYEDFLHRRQDPALLEKAAGNQFSARVFPIPANADKHLVIAFSQEVTPGHYTLPLRGLAKSDRVDVRVGVRSKDGSVAEQTMSQRDWTPDRDVVVDSSTVQVPPAIEAGELAAAQLTIDIPDAVEVPKAVTVLVDTSASRALGFAAQARTIHRLVDELAREYGGALPVQVVAFDQITTPLYDGRADAIGDIEAALVARGALGASDLGQALRWLGDHAPKARVVLVGDGVVTAGAKTDALPALAKQLAEHGVERIDVALSGGIRDEQAAIAVARSGLPHTGAVLDLDQGTAEVVRRLGLAVRTDLAVTAEGAQWTFPHAIAAAQSGDKVTVYVRRAAQAQQLVLSIAGKPTLLAPVGVTPALLDRAVASSEIAELDAQLATSTGEAAAKLRGEIVKRSVAARVVSSQTSMLVLESDADYARFGIERTALADILAIGPGGIELTHRTAPAPLQIAVVTTKQPPYKKGGKADKAEEVTKTELKEKDAEKLASADPPPAAGSATAFSLHDGKDDVVEPEPAVPSPAPEEPRMAAMPPPPPPAPPTIDPTSTMQGVSTLESQRAQIVRPPGAQPGVTVHAHEVTNGETNGSVRRAADSQTALRDGSGGGDDGLAMNRKKPSLVGPLAEIESALAAGRADAGLALARAWHDREPGDVLALIGLGDALEAKHDAVTAARVYGSIIDLYPARADFRRFAGERLERLGAAERALVIDTYQRAVEERPDHLTGHRLLAYALLRDGQYAEAFAAILAGIDHKYPKNRFAGAERVLAEDVGMIAAAYLAHATGKRDEVMKELAKRDLVLPTQPSTRFIMYWETDDNDVDFHIRDARGGHAWYSNKHLSSGGDLYADITTGYGPECFAIQGTPKAGPYELTINYFSQGPMGYGMGLLQIQKFDGRGNLSFEDRPYVIMTNQAFVDLGTYR